MAPGGYVYHALNRGVARLALFEKPADYDAFEAVLAEGLQEHPTRVLAYCVLPNHWHFVLWPERDGELTTFLRWLTHTHIDIGDIGDLYWRQFAQPIGRLELLA